MKKNQILVIALAIIGGLALFFWGNTVKPKKATQDTHEHQHTAAPMGGNLDNIPAADIQALTAAAKKKLKPQDLSQLEALEQQLLQAQTAAEKTTAYDMIGRFWHDKKNRLFAAYYVGQSGLLDNSEKKLTFASHLLSEDIQQENDPGIRKLMFEVADACYQQLLVLHPQDEDVMIDHQLLIINGAGNVMQGVLALRDWSEKHPDNKRAHLVLGEMSLRSQQFEKALERADKVMALDKNNLEAYLLKAQTHQLMGDVDKAIEVLNDAKKMMNNPQFSEDADKLINDIRQTSN